MKEGESVNDYFARTLTIANKMKANREDKGDVAVVEKILRSMTPKFDYVVCSIEESKDTDTLTIDELQSSLLVHELRMTFDKSTVECYTCHQLGHFSWECSNQRREANYVENEEEMLLMVHNDITKAIEDIVWFLDSGCSNHMCGKKEYFSDLDETYKDSVKLGNNSSMTVVGKGNVRLRMNGTTYIVIDVIFVPDLRNNLLSIGQLQEKGLSILFQHGKCKVFHLENGLVIETKISANRMYLLHVSSPPAKSTCFHSVTKDKMHLWHCRYGHLSFQGLNTLYQQYMVYGLPMMKAPTNLCQDCLIGKQSRDSFPKKSNWRATQVLQLIHADICGPITPISNSKKRYLLTFIDDFSRKTWIYFLIAKSEALSIFKIFKVHVEKEANSLIRSLRTDRGGEFTLQENYILARDYSLAISSLISR
uniref:Retrovirus-related Pol polyprotein from transposon TNT 1-94 n=1 Tax=Cajanus cajan TaxID=3821 RepID=A0A151QSZ1_CAJCA|nr:Retrovirus-related Pol polyprotein from transposon TNT 1-94 [Cajanus cajan]